MSVKFHVFKSFEYVVRSGMARSYDHSIFNFLRSCHMVFHNICIILHSYQRCTRVPISLLHQHLCSSFLITAMLMSVKEFLLKQSCLTWLWISKGRNTSYFSIWTSQGHLSGVLFNIYLASTLWQPQTPVGMHDPVRKQKHPEMNNDRKRGHWKAQQSVCAVEQVIHTEPLSPQPRNPKALIWELTCTPQAFLHLLLHPL